MVARAAHSMGNEQGDPKGEETLQRPIERVRGRGYPSFLLGKVIPLPAHVIKPITVGY